MKKVILFVILLGVLIGIIFVKTGRDQAQIDEAFRSGIAKGQLEVAAYQKRVESLRVSTDQYRLSWADSLRRHDSVFAVFRDSVKVLLLAQNDKIKELQKKARSSVKSTPKGITASVSKTKSDTDGVLNRHTQILTYYKTRYHELPGDLSTYERKAALTEIRQETISKFTITLAELDQIRKSNKLDY